MASFSPIFSVFWEDPFEFYCFFAQGVLFFLSFSLSAGEREIVQKIRDMEVIEERLAVYSVEVLDYRSILEALKGCAAVFCCLDSSDGYDDVRSLQDRFISN